MPKKVDHKLRREAFMAAAYRMIKKRGISGATFRAVAKEAGYTTGALVHYVDSMDKLLVEASEFSAREVRADMEKAENLPDKLEALRQVLYLALPSDEDKRGNWNFFLGFWERSALSADVRHLTHLRYVEWLKRTARLIRNARNAGDLPKDVDIKKASRACVALIDGIATQTLRSGSPLTPKAQRELIDAWIALWLKPLRKFGAKRATARRGKGDGAAHAAHS
ncbi:MAG: TetR family transcriptional regulator C-terminal domain-containing protein [Proteobacteria bacterium]|nr:TetR family transcriptional regulator C-terminal domain-containing protein [Pseudomonadota bacterium]